MAFRKHPMLMILIACGVFLAFTLYRHEESEEARASGTTTRSESPYGEASSAGELVWANWRNDPGVETGEQEPAAIGSAGAPAGPGKVPARFEDRIRGELRGVEFAWPEDR